MNDLAKNPRPNVRVRRLTKDVTDRQWGIGSSDIGSLFGLNPYCSLPELWLIKTGRRVKDAHTEPQAWGSAFEDVVAKRFSEKTRRRVQKIHATLVHPRYNYLLANPDRFQFDPTRPSKTRKGVLEVKCTRYANLRGWATNGIPAPYYLQLQHQLSVTGCTWGSFAILFGGNKLVEFDVERDGPVIDLILERCKAFWTLVKLAQPPPITLSAEWNAQLAHYFPTSVKGEEITLTTPAAIGRARRYLILKAQIQKREAELAEHEVFFKSAIGGAEKLLVPGVARFSWPSFERSHIDLDKLRSEHPAIAEQLTKKDQQRRFSCKALTDVSDDEEGDDDAAATTLPSVSARRIELD